MHTCICVMGRAGRGIYQILSCLHPSTTLSYPSCRNDPARPWGGFRALGPPWELASIRQIPSGRWARRGIELVGRGPVGLERRQAD